MYNSINELSNLQKSFSIYYEINADKKELKRFSKCPKSFNLYKYLGFVYLNYIIKYYYLNKSLLTIHHDCFLSNKVTTCIRQKPHPSFSLFLYAHFLLKLNFFKDMIMDFTKTDSHNFHLTLYSFPISGHNFFIFEATSFYYNTHLLLKANPESEINKFTRRNTFH